MAALDGPEHVDRARRRRRRSWSQRLLLGLNCVVILACFSAAGGVLLSRHFGNTIARVTLPGQAEASDVPITSSTVAAVTDSTTPNESVAPTATDGGPVETFPRVDPDALNFLITGADNNACVDADSPFAGAFGNRESMGDRSDTIMLMRVDPATRRAALLSFHRDLWVPIIGRGSKNRINTAYVRDDPTRLIGTIHENFGLDVDHFVQVDFCAFKRMVDAVGGVTVPFVHPARDPATGLNVPTAGCFTFSGDHALAYVRSRHYEYQTDNGTWSEDGTSDLGRISRQQDFLRRVLSAALAKGLNPSVAQGLLDAVQDYVVVDRNLTPRRMLEFAGILSGFEPGSIATYQIEAKDTWVGTNRVLLPRVDGDNMQAILAIFRGDAPLTGSPQQEFEPSADTVEPGAPTTTSSTPTTVEPPAVAGPEENSKGIVPPADMPC